MIDASVFDPTLGFPDIPEDRIAQSPAPERDSARLMHLDRADGAVRHLTFRDVTGLFRAGDALVLNDTRVFAARIEARKPTGGRVPLLLLERESADDGGEVWRALAGRAFRAGDVLSAGDGVSFRIEGARGEGVVAVRTPSGFSKRLEALGKPPLPPYIRRGVADEDDRARYQTVYARGASAPDTGPWRPGAVAAPTAGLHFTAGVLAAAEKKGVNIVKIKLDVGWGTFRSVRAADYREHVMLPESYDISGSAADAVNAARAKGGRVWGVGTTAVRALETAADEHGRIRPGAGETNLYITPGRPFRAVDALITNFHLPGHTPLLLAAAFAGIEPLKRAYSAALLEGYRFFSYGDAMAIT